MHHQPQMNQMPNAPVYYPAMPPQFYYGNDPASFPSPNGHWPLDTYPPVQCRGHGCCSHNYFPGHSAARPSYPYHNYVPTAPSFYPFCYPAPQLMYPPVTYFPPHCAMEMPGYEYNKDLLKGGGQRCSGWCQNHPSSGEHGGNVKIVEEENEVEKKTSSALVPFEAKNSPSRVDWLQPNNTMNAEGNKNLDDARCKILDKNFDAQQNQPILWNGWFPYDMRRVQSSNQEEAKKNDNQQHEKGAQSHEPNMWRGWVPFELSNLGSRKQGEEQEGTQHQKDDDKQKKLPYPIFWMPYKPSVTEGEEKPEIKPERDVSKKESSGDDNVPFHVVNVPPEKHTDDKEKPDMIIPREGNRVVKIIPVKQLKEQVEDKKTSSKDEEIKKKPLEKGTNKESSSPPKISKLPPVCLRVEPLPKRKGTNGNSRSPSPPGGKRKTDDVTGTRSPTLERKESREDQSEIAGERSKVAEKASQSTDRAAEAANGTDKQGEVKLGCKNGDDVSHGDTMTNENAKRLSNCEEDLSVDCDVRQMVSEDLEAKISAVEDQYLSTKDSSEEAEESTKVKFSDAEAATMIQATYRGFQVRKLEPLKKLKKLAEVKEEVAGIRRRIESFTASCNVKDHEKEKTMIMEMIMNLLLKLDAIQGLHVSIRDVRKAIAKELVSLQETLDTSVFMDNSQELLQQPSGLSSEEVPYGLKNEDINIELQKEDGGIEDHDLSKINHKVSPPVEQCEKQQFIETNSLPKFEDFEKSVPMVTRESLVDELKDVSNSTSGESDSTSVVRGNDEQPDYVQSPMEDSSRDDKELEMGQLFETQELGKEMSNFVDVSKEEMDIEISNILPLGEHKPGSDPSNHDHMGREVSGYAVEENSKDSSQGHEAPEEMQEGSQEEKEEEKITEDSKVEENIISSQDQVATEEVQEGSQEEKEEEKITEDSKVEEMIISSQDQVAREEMQEGSQEEKEEEKITEDSKVEEMIISSQDQVATEEMQEGIQEEKEEEKVTGDSKVEEMIISSQDQVVTEEMQEGSQEDKVEEKITDSVFPETILPLGDTYVVDAPIEVPKEVEHDAETCEADETTHFVVPKESEEAAGRCEADEPGSGFEREVEEITGRQKGQVLEKGEIEDPSTIHNDEQFEQAELPEEQMERDTGSVSGGEATLPEEVSSLINDDVQVELQKEDQGLGTDDLSASGGYKDDRGRLVTTSKEATGGFEEECNHMTNSRVEEGLEKHDHGLVSTGSEVVPPDAEKSGDSAVDANVLFTGAEKSDETDADETKNIGHVVSAGKMDAVYLSSDGPEENDELDHTMPSPTGSQASLESETVRKNDWKLMEENEKLKDLMEKLLEAGTKQLSTISELSSRINDLEKRISTKKKKQLRIRRKPKALHPPEISV